MSDLITGLVALLAAIPQAVAGRSAQVRLSGSDNLHTLEIMSLQND